MESDKSNGIFTRIMNWPLINLLGGSRGDLRFFRFLIVGASGLVVNNGLLVLLTEWLGIHYLVSAVLATQGSTLWNFGFTELWVFRDRDLEKRSKRLVRFFLLNNAALLLRGPLLTLMVSLLEIHYLVSNLVTLVVIALLRFTISDRLIWTPVVDNETGIPFRYNIHNIIGLESWIRLPELDHFQVPTLDKTPDICLGPERRKLKRLTSKSIHFRETLGRFGFECCIELDEPVRIFVSSLVLNSPHVLYTNIIEPVLRWTLVRKGYALLHAACVRVGEQTVLVTAQTDTGKTSTILKLLQGRYSEFLSDDMIILGEKEVHNYPKPLTISRHTLGSLESTTLSFKERAALQIQSRLHSRSGRRFALWMNRMGLPVATINAAIQILIPPPKYMIDRLIPGVIITESAKVSHVIQIERGPELSEKIDFSDILDKLKKNAEDAYGFPPYPEIAGELSQWETQDLNPIEREITRAGIMGKTYWRLRNPDYGWWHEIPAVVQRHNQDNRMHEQGKPQG